MDIIKKNLVSVISGVVAILAVAAMFWPINGLYANIDKSLAESEQLGQRVQNVISDIKNLKQPVADNNATPLPLGTFPTEDVIKEGERVVALLEKQSKAVMDRARNNNVHKVISEGSLPNMVGTSVFQRLLEADFRKRENFKATLNAANVLTSQSIQEEASKQFRDKWLPNIGKVGDSIDPTELRKEIERYNTTVLPVIKDQLIAQNAMKTMYVSASGLAFCPGVPQNISRSPKAEQIWWDHITMWVLEDLVAAIADTNNTYGRKDAKGNITVANAPVKRLVDTWVDPVYLTDKGFVAYAQPAVEAGVTHPMDVRPVMIGEEATGYGDDIPKSFKDSFTGRVSNTVYDVIPFRFTIDVEAKHTRDLMAKLINQRYITITECKMMGLDRDYLQKCGLVYGNERCVQMTVDAELLLFRQWTLPLMPEAVKEKMGLIKPQEPGM